MIILVCIILWVTLGALGSWFGWAMLDKRKYDLEMTPFVVMLCFGPFTLMAAIFVYCVDHKLFSRFAKIKVFKRKTK